MILTAIYLKTHNVLKGISNSVTKFDNICIKWYEIHGNCQTNGTFNFTDVQFWKWHFKSVPEVLNATIQRALHLQKWHDSVDQTIDISYSKINVIF